MRIRNATGYSSEHLRAIVKVVAASWTRTAIKEVEIVNRARAGPPLISGYQSRKLVRLKLSKYALVDATTIAGALRCGFWLTTVYRFSELPTKVREMDGEDLKPALESAKVPPALLSVPPPAVPPLTLTEKRTVALERLCARERTWESKRKKAETFLKKIRQQKKRLERIQEVTKLATDRSEQVAKRKQASIQRKAAAVEAKLAKKKRHKWAF